MELTNEQWLRIEAHHITIDAQERSAGLKIKARKGCDERDIMDITNRSPLEGYAFEISAIPDRPSTLPGMDKTRDFPGNFIRAGRRPV